ncbi:MAG TPA: DUF3014 domain-containing protein, partial [Thermoanaerobaculia bacterium]|nr:DUF3014 domain-containing protein [Thermoanaerobaculia bacterium]
EPPPRPRWPWLAAAVVVAGVVGWYYFQRSGAETSPPPPSAPAPTEQAAPPAEPTVPLPALDQSDGWLRERLSGLSSHPDFARWLQGDQLARRGTAALAALAEGRSPREQLPSLAPAGRFAAVERGGKWYVSPQAYARYDGIADVVESIDADAAGGLYRLAKPLLEAAHNEIAAPEATLDGAVGTAIARLLATPVPSDDPEVVEGEGLVYTYADPALEGLAPAQKHLLRTGPRNMRLIQAKLRGFAEAAGLATGAPAAPTPP